MRVLCRSLSDIVLDVDRHLLKAFMTWQTDLVDMQSLSNHNDGVKFYLLISTRFQRMPGFVP